MSRVHKIHAFLAESFEYHSQQAGAGRDAEGREKYLVTRMGADLNTITGGKNMAAVDSVVRHFLSLQPKS